MKALERTSRSVFSSFCDALDSGGDKHSGGAPQMIGLYRQKAGRSFGIIYNDKRYFEGLPVSDTGQADGIEWRNRRFEICDGATMQRRKEAQPQPRPTQLRSI